MIKNLKVNLRKLKELFSKKAEEQVTEQVIENTLAEDDELSLLDVEKANKRKKIAVISTSAIIATASVVTLSSLFMGINKKKNEEISSDDIVNDDEIVSELDTLGMDDLGIELAFTEENKEYGETTGNVDVKNIVTDNNGTTWVNKEAADKANTVGKVVTDTKNDTLKVEEDGKVVEKQEGYEIKDKDDNVVSSGEGSIPPGYSWDSKRNEYVPTSEVGKYVYSDSDFYSQDGTKIISKGDLVSVDTYNRAKKELLTKKPETNNPSDNNKPNKPSQPTNPNGTYTDSLGNVWASKSDYDKGVADSDGIYMENGVLHYREKTNNNTSNQTKPTPAPTPTPESKPSQPTNPNGTYTDSLGNVWASKADYDKAVANNWDKVGEVGGVLYYDPQAQYGSKTK